MHNNLQRKVNEHRAHISGSVPAVAIHSFFKNAQEPRVSEGFESIHKIEFKADSFDNAEDKKAYETIGQK